MCGRKRERRKGRYRRLYALEINFLRTTYNLFFAVGKEQRRCYGRAFGHDRRTGLVALDGDPTARRGGVTSWVIRCLNEAFLPGVMVEGGEFVHDVASVHRGHIVWDILRDMGVRVMR
jgi:hypothetical protein